MKTSSIKTIGAIFAAASIASVACVAIAQPQGQGFGQGQGQGQGGRGGRGGDPAQMSQRIHNQLQITAAQESAFNTWVAAIRPAGPPTPPTPPAEGATTLQKLDQAAAVENQRATAFRASVAATRTFYNQLSPAQRQTFDNLPIVPLIVGGPAGRGGRGRGDAGQPGVDGPRAGLGGRGGQGGRGPRGGGQGGPNGFDPNAPAQ